MDQARPAPDFSTRVLVSNVVNARRYSKYRIGDGCARGTEPSAHVTRRIVFTLDARGVNRGSAMDRLRERARTADIIAQRLGYGFVAVLPFDDVCLADMLATS